jgi:hypothetical protein
MGCESQPTYPVSKLFAMTIRMLETSGEDSVSRMPDATASSVENTAESKGSVVLGQLHRNYCHLEASSLDA